MLTHTSIRIKCTSCRPCAGDGGGGHTFSSLEYGIIRISCILTYVYQNTAVSHGVTVVNSQAHKHSSQTSAVVNKNELGKYMRTIALAK